MNKKGAKKQGKPQPFGGKPVMGINLADAVNI